MRYLSLLVMTIYLLIGGVGCLSDRSTSVDAGMDIDVYPITRTLEVKIEKRRANKAYDKVVAYIDEHKMDIFNAQVTLSFATKAGEKLQARIAEYLKSEGMNMHNLSVLDTAQADNKRFDFALEVLEYRVQVPLCQKPAIYYSYKDNGCAIEANLWLSKTNPEKSLRKDKQ